MYTAAALVLSFFPFAVLVALVVPLVGASNDRAGMGDGQNDFPPSFAPSAGAAVAVCCMVVPHT